MSEDRKVSIDTMTGAGKTIELVGREYVILPVNIEDMKYIIGDDNPDEKLIILDKKKFDEGKEGLDWQLFGINLVDPKRRKTFLYIVNKYIFYKGVPMTEELLIEHNWSFKEIGKFLFEWCQVSD
jgi:hypothetical protein|nr:MAG TPA: hypothetical protein [Caudoviricetes sp.]